MFYSQLAILLIFIEGGGTEHNIFKYALFLSFFPAIVQGPISRYKQLSIQLFQEHHFKFEQFCHELLLIVLGIIKKVVIADNVAIIANYCFSNVTNLEGFVLYIGAVAYSIQLYMDFSGCVDICRGISGLFGIQLIQNFDSPYFSKSIKEFWRRWHISLSSWLKDYIYIPLGGNKKSIQKKYLNVFIVFFISGIWHGAGFSFIIWGIIHALYQIIGDMSVTARSYIKNKLHIVENSKSDKIYKTIITFNLVTFAWIFFRAPSLEIAFEYIANMFKSFNIWVFFDGSLFTYGLNENILIVLFLNIAFITYVDLLHFKNNFGLRKNIQSLHIFLRWSIYFILIYDILLFGVYGVGVDPSAFLYGGF